MNITNEMVTEKYGFVKGCVILINERPYKYSHYIADKELGEYIFVSESIYISIHDIKSIKVIIGPMSFWNHAPDWAKYAEVREMGIAWHYAPPCWWDGKSEVIKARPWWSIKPTAYDKEIQEYDRSKN